MPYKDPEVLKAYKAEHYRKNKEKALQRSKDWYEANKPAVKARADKYREENREALQAANKLFREQNRERLNAEVRQRRAENPDRFREYERRKKEKHHEAIKARKREAYALFRASNHLYPVRRPGLDPFLTDEQRQQRSRESQKRYFDNNKEKCRSANKRWQSENPAKYRAAMNHLSRKRKAAKSKATPKWADMEAIREMYRESAFLTDITGSPYHVDHIVPLVSRLVCGLHCEANLRVIPGAENQAKSNRWWPDMP
jgi:hypothetical protein